MYNRNRLVKIQEVLDAIENGLAYPCHIVKGRIVFEICSNVYYYPQEVHFSLYSSCVTHTIYSITTATGLQGYAIVPVDDRTNDHAVTNSVTFKNVRK